MDQPILLEKLISAYAAYDFTVRVGLNPNHWDETCKPDAKRDAPFACLARDGHILHFGGGLSIQELYFFELLARVFCPKRIFIIGNGFGWSTIALALVFHHARVVAIDNATEGLAQHGLDLANRIIADLKLNAVALRRSSPDDVSSTIDHEFGGVVDLALIDGLHTNEQQTIDYRAIKPHLARDSVIAFHDVMNWHMLESFRAIQNDWAGPSHILLRTPSGMGICYSDAAASTAGRVIRLFTDPTIPL